MKTNSWKILISLVCATWSLAWAVPDTCNAQSPGVPQGVVEAVTGTVTMTVNQDEEPVVLSSGSVVNAWNMVSTDEASKLLLNWSTGILNSLGPFTSIFLTSNQTERGPLDSIEMTEGILRVNNPGASNRVPPYMVATPVAQIEPAKPDEPVDFIVEVHDPGTTSVTVIAGLVRVRNMTLKRTGGNHGVRLSKCLRGRRKTGSQRRDIDLRRFDRLVEASTLPGSIRTTFMCPAPTAELPPPPPSSTYVPNYVYEDWSSYDTYPFDEITIAPPRPGVGCIVVLPGIGRWIIPRGSVCRMAVRSRAREDLLQARRHGSHAVLRPLLSHGYETSTATAPTHDVSAQLSGNRSMLIEAQRKLADINVRSHWASMRLKRLEGNMATLQKEQQKLAHNMPQGQSVLSGYF